MARARGAYRMTAKRRAALRKAQMASARKRRGRAIKVAAGVGTAAVLGAAVYRHKASGSSFSAAKRPNVSAVTGSPLPSGLRVGRAGKSVLGTYGRSGQRYQIAYNHKSLGKARRTVVGLHTPDMSTRRISAAPVNAGSIPSRVIKKHVSTLPTMTKVRHPYAVEIMKQGKRARFA